MAIPPGNVHLLVLSKVCTVVSLGIARGASCVLGEYVIMGDSFQTCCRRNGHEPGCRFGPRPRRELTPAGITLPDEIAVKVGPREFTHCT